MFSAFAIDSRSKPFPSLALLIRTGSLIAGSVSCESNARERSEGAGRGRGERRLARAWPPLPYPSPTRGEGLDSAAWRVAKTDDAKRVLAAGLAINTRSSKTSASLLSSRPAAGPSGLQELPPRYGGNAKPLSPVRCGTGSKGPSGARGAAVAYASVRLQEVSQRRHWLRGESVGPQSPKVAGSSPVCRHTDSSIG